MATLFVAPLPTAAVAAAAASPANCRGRRTPRCAAGGVGAAVGRWKRLAAAAALGLAVATGVGTAEAGVVQEEPLRLRSAIVAEATGDGLTVRWEGLRSLNSRRETYVLFENRSDRLVDVNWVDFQGREQIYASVAPGAVHLQPSFATHPWAVRDHVTQRALRVFVATPAPAVARITNPGAPQQQRVPDDDHARALIRIFGEVGGVDGEFVPPAARK